MYRKKLWLNTGYAIYIAYLNHSYLSVPLSVVAFVQSCNSCMSKPVSVGVREYAYECNFLYWLMQTLKQPNFFSNVHQKYLDSCQNYKKEEGMTTND